MVEKDLTKNASLRGLEEEWHISAEGIAKGLFTDENNVSIQTLYNVMKSSPEVMACLMAVVEDVVGDYWRYWGNKGNIKRALEFETKVGLYNVLANAILELEGTGNAYILKLGVDSKKLKSILSNMTTSLQKSLNIKLSKEDKVRASGDTIYQILQQDGIEIPKDLQLLKSSTVTINYDKTGQINGYIQRVEGQAEKRFYSKDDIIHLKLLNIGGQPYGFTPLEPLLSDLANLIFAKEFAGNYFENDGMPAWIINLPESNPDDRNYEVLKKELKDFKEKSNKLRTLITTGKMTAEQINKFNKDMEYGNLIQHFTNLVLMALGVPAQRVNFYNLKGVRTQDTQGLSMNGYFKKVGFIQRSVQDILNKELWSAFGVTMKFKQSYLLDEMREAQIVQILTQAQLITVEEARDMMGLIPQMPKGTMPKSTGDDMAIDFKNDKQEQEGKGESTDPPKDGTDNKVKPRKE